LARKYENNAKTDDCFSKISKSENGKPDAGKLPSFFEALRRSASFAQNTFTNGPS
jgi:hypothetical protein